MARSSDRCARQQPSWLVLGMGAATLATAVSCALADTGTNGTIQAGEDEHPRVSEGTGGTAVGDGGASALGEGRSSIAVCGNGFVERGEICDVGDAATPPRNLCVGCQIDSIMLYSVAGTTTPPTYVDEDGRLHYYYLATYHPFDDAAESCKLTGAYLITLQSDAEVDIADELLGSDPGWVGAREQRWTTGEPWEYLPKGGYTPDTTGASCVALDPSVQALEERSCTDLLQAVCEWVAPGSP